jgi:hypothetical protein
MNTHHVLKNHYTTQTTLKRTCRTQHAAGLVPATSVRARRARPAHSRPRRRPVAVELPRPTRRRHAPRAVAGRHLPRRAHHRRPRHAARLRPRPRRAAAPRRAPHTRAGAGLPLQRLVVVGGALRAPGPAPPTLRHERARRARHARPQHRRRRVAARGARPARVRRPLPRQPVAAACQLPATGAGTVVVLCKQ